MGGEPPGPEDQGKCHRCFPHPLSPRKPVGLPGLVPCLPGPSPATWVLGAWGGGEKKRDQRGGTLWDRRIGGTDLAFPPPPWAQGACWGPEPGPPPSKARGTAGPSYCAEPKRHHPPLPAPLMALLGLKHRPCLPPKPRPYLSPATHRQGLFWLFFFLLSFSIVVLFYLLVVVPSIYLFIFYFF